MRIPTGHIASAGILALLGTLAAGCSGATNSATPTTSELSPSSSVKARVPTETSSGSAADASGAQVVRLQNDGIAGEITFPSNWELDEPGSLPPSLLFYRLPATGGLSQCFAALVARPEGKDRPVSPEEYVLTGSAGFERGTVETTEVQREDDTSVEVATFMRDLGDEEFNDLPPGIWRAWVNVIQTPSGRVAADVMCAPGSDAGPEAAEIVASLRLAGEE
jgi:hypothetical protein